MNIVEIIKDRFDKVWALIKASTNSDIYPEESKIRLEQPIVNGKGQYIFSLKNDSVDGVVEHALNRNDVFVPTRWGLFVSLVETATGTEHLYPYIPVADGSNPSVHKFGFLTDALEALYSGFMSWTLDNNVVLSAYPLEKFRTVPQVQGAFVLDSSDQAVNEGILPEWKLDDFMTLITPRYTIAGTRDHKFTFNFPAANKTFACTSGYTAKLVFMMDGFLIKGGCEYVEGSNAFGKAAGQW